LASANVFPWELVLAWDDDGTRDLFKGHRCRETIPILSNESSKSKQDLLAGQQTRVFPCLECPFGTVDGTQHFLLRRLWDASDGLLGSGVTQIDPAIRLRALEFVVDEVECLGGLGDLGMMFDVVILDRGSVSSCVAPNDGRLQMATRRRSVVETERSTGEIGRCGSPS